MYKKAPKSISMLLKMLCHARYVVVKVSVIPPLQEGTLTHSWLTLLHRLMWAYSITIILCIGLCLVFWSFFFFFMFCARRSISRCFSVGFLIVMVTDWTVFLHRLSDIRVADLYCPLQCSSPNC